MRIDFSWLAFWALVWAVMWALKRRPNSRLSKAAFTWFGPSATSGEPLSSLQGRWLAYSFGWLCQFALALSALVFVASRLPSLGEQQWFLLICFVLGMGIMLAGLATLGFAIKFFKARYVGPDPMFVPTEKSQ
jgi:hypothetical protein